MKKLVQIGLHETCEYLYVTHPNWPALRSIQINPEFPFIPEEFWGTGAPWLYYGVEMSRKSLEYISERLDWKKSFGRVQLLQECITPTDGLEVQHNGWSVGDGPYTLRGISLKTLFLKTGVPDVLVMNILNGEGSVFETYDFAEKPKLIIVHIHSHTCLNVILKRMLENGYHLLAMPYATTDILVCSFLQTDLVSPRLRDIWCWG